MRDDMDKVTTERPRAGGGYKTPKGSKKELQKGSWDDLPKKEGIRFQWMRGWNHKEFTDLLGPLRRWLHSKIGHKWDNVYSEICENLKRSSTQQDHIRDHINSEVEKDVVIINRIPHHKTTHRYRSGELPRLSDGQLYVHPITGILREWKERKYQKPKEETVRVQVDETHQCHKIKDIWYMVEVTPVVFRYEKRKRSFTFDPRRFWYDNVFFAYDDIILGRVERASQATDFYGGAFKAVSKRQMNSKEIKKYVSKD